MNKIILCFALFLGAYIQPSMAQKASPSVQFNRSLKDYYALKNALAADQAAEAQKVALVFLQDVKDMPHTGFASRQQHELWMVEAAKLGDWLTAVAATTELKAQRYNFEGVSTSMILLTRELKLNRAPVFVAYCPMGKYSWLTEVKTIQNPYYGSEMSDCGTIKGAIGRK